MEDGLVGQGVEFWAAGRLVCVWVKSQADERFLDGVSLKRIAEMIRFRDRHSSSYCCASFFCFFCTFPHQVPHLLTEGNIQSESRVYAFFFLIFIPRICHEEKATFIAWSPQTIWGIYGLI